VTRGASVELAHGAPLFLLVAAALVLLPLLAALLGLFPGSLLDLSRSVLVHASGERVWEFVRRLPDLHARHGKIRDFGSIAEWTLRHGDGESEGSVWRARGTWGDSPYWGDVEILRFGPGKELTVRLRRDSLGTEKGLRDHLGSLTLEEIGPDATKLTWRLRARLRGPRLLCARLVSSPRLRARLLDQGLRSLKVEIDNATRELEHAADRSTEPSGTLAVPAPPPPARMPPQTTA
jgi:hypothetical protein